MFKSARYMDAERSVIEAWTEDGRQLIVPAVKGNRDFRLLTEGDEDAGIAPTSIAEHEVSQ